MPKLDENILLHDILNEITFNHSHNTRHIGDYRLPAISTDINKHFFLTNAIKFWRTLSLARTHGLLFFQVSVSLDIKNSTSIQSFRSKLKNLYFNQDSRLLMNNFIDSCFLNYLYFLSCIWCVIPTPPQSRLSQLMSRSQLGLWLNW